MTMGNQKGEDPLRIWYLRRQLEKSKVKPLICKHVVDASLKVITVVTVWSR